MSRRIDYRETARAADIYAVAAACGLSVDDQNKALCPFHADRKPSLHIYADGYHCFVCGAHGDAIDLVEGVQRCTKREAAEIVARLSGGEVLHVQGQAGGWNAQKRMFEQLERDRELRDDTARLIDITHDVINELPPYSPVWQGAYRLLDKLMEIYNDADSRILAADLRRLEEKNERKERAKRGGRRP